jgi:hypothetical protein
MKTIPKLGRTDREFVALAAAVFEQDEETKTKIISRQEEILKEMEAAGR